MRILFLIAILLTFKIGFGQLYSVRVEGNLLQDSFCRLIVIDIKKKKPSKKYRVEHFGVVVKDRNDNYATATNGKRISGILSHGDTLFSKDFVNHAWNNVQPGQCFIVFTDITCVKIKKRRKYKNTEIGDFLLCDKRIFLIKS